MVVCALARVHGEGGCICGACGAATQTRVLSSVRTAAVASERKVLELACVPPPSLSGGALGVCAVSGKGAKAMVFAGLRKRKHAQP